MDDTQHLQQLKALQDRLAAAHAEFEQHVTAQIQVVEELQSLIREQIVIATHLAMHKV